MLGLLRRHGRNAGFALWDQGAFSAGNFIFNVMLARWLDGAAYGTVTLVLSLGLSILAFYSAFVLETSSVIGPTRYAGSLRSYFCVLFRLHVLLTGAFFALCLLAAAIALAPLQRMVMWLLAASTPFVLLVWLARRLPYVMGVPAAAAAVSTLYAVLLLAGAFALRAFDMLSPVTAVATASLGSAAAAGLLPVWLRRVPQQVETLKTDILGRIVREHWRYSRWLLLAGLLALPSSFVQSALAAAFLGVEAVGILRAVGNLVVPTGLLVTATSGFSLSLIARDIAAGNGDAAWRKARIITIVLTAICVTYYFLILMLGPTLDDLLYAGRYQQHIQLVAILGLTPVLSALGVGGALFIRAVEKTQFALASAALSGPASAAASVLLMPRYGLEGAAISAVIPPTIAVAVIFYFASRERRHARMVVSADTVASLAAIRRRSDLTRASVQESSPG